MIARLFGGPVVPDDQPHFDVWQAVRTEPEAVLYFLDTGAEDSPTRYARVPSTWRLSADREPSPLEVYRLANGEPIDDEDDQPVYAYQWDDPADDGRPDDESRWPGGAPLSEHVGASVRGMAPQGME